MKFAIARSPATALSPAVFYLSWVLIVMLIAMISLQLMTFEKFSPIIQNYQLFDNFVPGKILAAGLVILEVSALPFLLRMSVSPLLRVISALGLMLASLGWLMLGVWVYTAHSPTIGSGLLGGVLTHLSASVVLPFGIILLGTSFTAVYCLRRDFKT